MPSSPRSTLAVVVSAAVLTITSCGGGTKAMPTGAECQAERQRLQASVDAFASSEQVAPADAEQLIEQGFYSGQPVWHTYDAATGVVAKSACADGRD